MASPERTKPLSPGETVTPIKAIVLFRRVLHLLNIVINAHFINFIRINKVNEKKIFLSILTLLILFILAGCSTTSKDFFVKTDKCDLTNSEYEYVGDIIVRKGGFKFLWFIPFAFSSIEDAKELMIEKAQWGFPGAIGAYEFKELVSEREEVSLFDWTPRTVIGAKIVKKRN